MNEPDQDDMKIKRNNDNIFINKYNITLSPLSKPRKKRSGVCEIKYFNNIFKFSNPTSKNSEDIQPSDINNNNSPITGNKIDNKKINQVTDTYIEKIKNNLLKKIEYPYKDSSKIYNIMLINNILSKQFSPIKQKYIEKLNEYESNDFLKIYSFNEVRCYLKYICVCYDKFHFQFPNYSKDNWVYNKMMTYLWEKQKIIDSTKENNKKHYILRKIKKRTAREYEVYSKVLDSKVMDEINSDDDNYYKRRRIGEIGSYIDISENSIEQLESFVKRLNKAGDIFNLPKSRSTKKIYTLTEVFLKKKKKPRTNVNFAKNGQNLFENDEEKAKYEIFTKKIRTKKRHKTEVIRNRKKLTIEDSAIKSTLKKYNQLRNKKIKPVENKKAKMKIKLKNKKKYIQDLRKTMKTEYYNNNLLKNTMYIIKNKNAFKNNILIKKESTTSTNSNSKNNINAKKNKYVIDRLKMRAFKSTENYCLYKNRKYLIKNMNDNLNDFRFNIQILLNFPEKINNLTDRKDEDFITKHIKLLNNLTKENEYKNGPKQREKKRCLAEGITNCKKNVNLPLSNNARFNSIKKRNCFLDSVFSSPKKDIYGIYKTRNERVETQNDRINSNIITLNKELRRTESLYNKNYHKYNLTTNFLFNKNQKEAIENYKSKKRFENVYGGKWSINKYESKYFSYQNRIKTDENVEVYPSLFNGKKKKDKKILLIKC